MTANATRETILTAARAMVQAQGYNSLSFRDLGAAIGIKSSSVHHYFPSKGDLGAELARRYTDEFVGYLRALQADAGNWKACIGSYTDVFRATLLRENRMCLGGMLAAERPELAPEVRAEVERFTELLVGWLTEVLLIGNPGMEQKAVRRWAFGILAAIEGAQLVARGCGDVAIFDDTLLAYGSAGLLP
jgi:TetR/AcrR family transcriptional repressor of nem operon